MTRPYVILDCAIDGAPATVLLNGCPQLFLEGPVGGSARTPVNENLVAGRNVIQIRFTLSDVVSLASSPAGVDLLVIHEVEGDLPDTPRVLMRESLDTDGLRERLSSVSAQDGSVSIGFSFDNPTTIDNLHRLGPDVPTAVESDVAEYGRRLLQLRRSGSPEKLFEEFKPKLADYAVSYFNPSYATLETFLALLEDRLFSYEPIDDYQELVCTPYSNNRIWRLTRDADPLFQSRGEGGDWTMGVLVQLVDGLLRVIR